MTAGSDRWRPAAWPALSRPAPWAPDAMRSGYRRVLRELHTSFVRLGEDVVDGARVAVEDPGHDGVLDLDVVAGRAEQLEDRAFTTIAREAPVSGDLRATIAVIRATHDLVRAGRLVLHVGDAWAVLAVQDRAATAGFDRLHGAAVEVLAGGVQAWRDRDALAIADLRVEDRHVDALRDELLDDLPRDGSQDALVAYVLLCRYLERLGDHGVNLAAQAAWAVTGDRVAGQEAIGGPGV